jgi:RNA-directed DNA polymerase
MPSNGKASGLGFAGAMYGVERGCNSPNRKGSIRDFDLARLRVCPGKPGAENPHAGLYLGGEAQGQRRLLPTDHNIDHALLLRALRKHTACPWVLLYVARWFQAPVQGQDGTLIQRGQGVPQGGCMSPVLANLFLHSVFDAWMQQEHPSIPFERYADDIIAHCQSEVQARWLQARIATRLAQCHLELHPTKTHMVYCKDADRRGTFPQERFACLGYTFRPRRSKNRRGKYFINFTPAVSARATKAMRQTIRSWRLHLRSDQTLDDLARMFNPILRGWVQYYGQYYKSALYPTFQVLERILVKWAMRKYKKLKGHQRRATPWLGRIARRQPRLFVHWQMGVRPAAGR